ncbi:MAG: hypothetical protein ACKEQI_00465 [Candidatus Hodgkinia cicadicola]
MEAAFNAADAANGGQAAKPSVKGTGGSFALATWLVANVYEFW